MSATQAQDTRPETAARRDIASICQGSDGRWYIGDLGSSMLQSGTGWRSARAAIGFLREMAGDTDASYTHLSRPNGRVVRILPIGGAL